MPTLRFLSAPDCMKSDRCFLAPSPRTTRSTVANCGSRACVAHFEVAEARPSSIRHKKPRRISAFASAGRNAPNQAAPCCFDNSRARSTSVSDAWPRASRTWSAMNSPRGSPCSCKKSDNTRRGASSSGEANTACQSVDAVIDEVIASGVRDPRSTRPSTSNTDSPCLGRPLNRPAAAHPHAPVTRAAEGAARPRTPRTRRRKS